MNSRNTLIKESTAGTLDSIHDLLAFQKLFFTAYHWKEKDEEIRIPQEVCNGIVHQLDFAMHALMYEIERGKTGRTLQ